MHDVRFVQVRKAQNLTFQCPSQDAGGLLLDIQAEGDRQSGGLLSVSLQTPSVLWSGSHPSFRGPGWSQSPSHQVHT